jgi:hypothetical protein
VSADGQFVLGEAGEGDLHDREVAQQLLHDRDDGGRLVSHAGVQLRSAEQHDRAQREHRGRRLEAAGERAVGETPEIEVADLVAVLPEDLPDQSGPGVGALPLALGEQELAGRTHRPHDRRAADADVEPGRAELAKALAVFVPQPEQLADHQERDREGERPDQVHDSFVLRGDPFGLDELLFDDPVDRRSEPREAAHRELRGEQLAQSRVVGGIGEAEPADVAVLGTGLAVVGAHVG